MTILPTQRVVLDDLNLTIFIKNARRSYGGMRASVQVYDHPTDNPDNPDYLYADVLRIDKDDQLLSYATEVCARLTAARARTHTDAPLAEPARISEVIKREWVRLDNGGDRAEDAATGATDKRRWINAGIGDLPAVGSLLWDAIRATNDPPTLFTYGGLPTRLDSDDDGAPRMRDLDVNGWRYEVACRVRCYKDDEAGRKIVPPPIHYVNHLLATPQPPLPLLRRVVGTPVFAPTGALQTTPGYHAESAVYYQPPAGLTIPDVPHDPSDEQIAAARQLIRDDLLGDFPFASTADRANAIAAFLLPYARDLIAGPTPLHLIEAPSPGSGKGLLAEVLLAPAIGRTLAVMSPATSDDEWRKRITSALRDAPVAVLIDNCTRALDSGVLAAVLTARHWSDRVLGQSLVLHLLVRCVWLATANNPTMSTEMARRVVRIRLDPKMDRPWTRTAERFTHPKLNEWADSHRADLVGAALTLIQAWIAKGRPSGTVPLGSYEQWAAVMGGILDTAGIPNFLGNLAALYEASDLEGAVWRVFVAAWWEKFASSEVGATDLFPLAVDTEGLDLGGGQEKSQRTSFGKQLARQRDRVIGGDERDYRIVQAGTKKRAAQWQLLPAEREVNIVNVGERSGAGQNENTTFNGAQGSHTPPTDEKSSNSGPTLSETFTNVHYVHPDDDDDRDDDEGDLVDDWVASTPSLPKMHRATDNTPPTAPCSACGASVWERSTTLSGEWWRCATCWPVGQATHTRTEVA